jgi:hypothetical protein
LQNTSNNTNSADVAIFLAKRANFPSEITGRTECYPARCRGCEGLKEVVISIDFHVPIMCHVENCSAWEESQCLPAKH